MKKPASKAEKDYYSRVAALGCAICGMPGEVHHQRHGIGMARKAHYTQTFCLCPLHHRTGNFGEAFHSGPLTWEKRFGTEESFVKMTQKKLNYDHSA